MCDFTSESRLSALNAIADDGQRTILPSIKAVAPKDSYVEWAASAASQRFQPRPRGLAQPRPRRRRADSKPERNQRRNASPHPSKHAVERDPKDQAKAEALEMWRGDRSRIPRGNAPSSSGTKKAEAGSRRNPSRSRARFGVRCVSRAIEASSPGSQPPSSALDFPSRGSG